jgi:hypothetical protein
MKRRSRQSWRQRQAPNAYLREVRWTLVYPTAQARAGQLQDVAPSMDPWRSSPPCANAPILTTAIAEMGRMILEDSTFLTVRNDAGALVDEY